MIILVDPCLATNFQSFRDLLRYNILSVRGRSHCSWVKFLLVSVPAPTVPLTNDEGRKTALGTRVLLSGDLKHRVQVVGETQVPFAVGPGVEPLVSAVAASVAPEIQQKSNDQIGKPDRVEVSRLTGLL